MLRRNDLFSGIGCWVLKLTLLTMPFAYLPGHYQGAGLPKTLFLQGALLMLSGCCLLGSRTRMPSYAPFVLPLVLFLSISALAAFRSLNPSSGLMLLTLQSGGTLLVIVTAGLVPSDRIFSVIRFSAIAGVGVSAMGLLEYLGVPWAMFSSAGRPSATFGFRNLAAMYLALNLCLSAMLLFGKARWDRVLGTVAVVGMAVFLMFTRTRAAWVGLCVGLAVGGVIAFKIRSGEGQRLWAFLWERLAGWQKAAGVVFLVLLVGLGQVQPGFRDVSPHRLDEKKTTVKETVASIVEPGGDRGRFRVWFHTLEMIRDYPVFGVGLDNWSATFPEYDRGDVLGITVSPRRPHNDFLWIWAELGTVGLGVYLWFLWAVGATLWRRARQGEKGMPALLIGVGFVALLVQSFFSFPREQAPVWILLGVALGLVGGQNGQGGRVKNWGAVAGVLGALGGIVLCVQALRFDTHFAGSLSAQDLGHTRIQVAEAEKALHYGVFDHRVYLLLGQGRFREKDHGGAVEAYRDYLRYQPFLPAVHNNLGRAFEALGDLEAAKASYKQGLEILANNGMLLTNLAGVYQRQGDVDQALAIYRDSEPFLDATGLHNLGLIYAQQGVFDRALAAYEKALVHNPDLLEVYFSMAGLYLLMGDFEHSAATYELFLERWRGAQDYVRDAHKRLGQLYPVLSDRFLARGDFEGAKRAYQRLEDLGGATAEIYNNLAIIYRRMGDRAGALTACRKALALDPDFGQAYFTLAQLLDESGDQKGALKNFRAFLNRWSRDDRFAQEAKRRVGELEEKR